MHERHIVVTGGTGALGRAVVQRLLQDGCHCHVTWTHAEELEEFPHHERISLHEVDCTDPAAVSALYADLDELEASVHLVGGFSMEPLSSTPLSLLREMWDINLVTAFLCCQAASAKLRQRGGGRLVNVAARPALAPAAGMIAYAIAKGAVASLTQHLAEELRDDDILVNAVAPSLIDTRANRAAMPHADHERWPKPPEIAETIAFLASPANTLSSGAIIPVYGKA